MAVYVDESRPCLRTPRWRWPAACHLVADDYDELRRFAARIEVDRAGFVELAANWARRRLHGAMEPA